DWLTADGTAIAGSDYTAGSGTLTFAGNAGETQTITVALTDDLIVETDETFLVNLTNIQAASPNVSFIENQATATIIDEDTAGLSIANVTVDENAGTATLTVTLDAEVEGGVSVDWSTADGTAQAGTDYTAGAGTLTFTGTAGETQTITITLTDDSVVELTESVLVSLSNLVALNGVTVVQAQATASIRNDDSLVINEDAPEQSVYLTGIVASVSGAQVQTVTAASDNHTLVPDPVVSYVAGNTTGILRFTPHPDQHGSATITITVTDDLSVESTHTFTLVVIPVNDDPTVTAPVLSIITENDDSYSLNLLSGAADVDVTDTLSVAGLTLVSGDASGITDNGTTLGVDPSVYNSLAAGETEVITYNYNIVDGNGGVVAQTLTITIIGINDTPTVSAALTSTVSEDDGAYSLDLLTGAADVDLSDTLSVSGLTLVSGDASGITDNGTSLGIDPSAYNSLAVGETEVVTYSYNVIDGNGGVVAQTVTVT
ncbi:MAG: Calx-beta domain-containing protein, partial [Gimesia chilikensis]